jgi:hypothetical protein
MPDSWLRACHIGSGICIGLMAAVIQQIYFRWRDSVAKSFVSPIQTGCTRGDRALMGTTSFCDELTDDFRGPFEVIDRQLPLLWSFEFNGVLGLLQIKRALVDMALAGGRPRRD